MSESEVAAFLAERGRYVRVGTVDPTGMPRVVPAWFLTREYELLVTPRARSVWLANLRRDPRACFLIDEERGVVRRRVFAQGEVRIVHDVGADHRWRNDYEEMAISYMGSEAAHGYLADTAAEPRALLALDLSRATVRSFRTPTPSRGEEPTALWADHYYHDRPNGPGHAR